MKTFFALLLLALALPGFAQTMEARRIKVEMLQRAIDLETHAKDGRRLFRESKITEGCAEVAYLFRNGPAHTRSVLARMNPNKRAVRRVQDQSVELLQLIDGLQVDCESRNHDEVDPDLAARSLQRYASIMDDHHDEIEDRSVEFHNSWSYEY
jgi:hypothetical protein